MARAVAGKTVARMVTRDPNCAQQSWGRAARTRALGLATAVLAAFASAAATPTRSVQDSAPQAAAASDLNGRQKRYRVLHLPADVPPPVVDGSPDDLVWALAPVLDGFVQVEPRPGLAVSQRTELKLLRTDDALFVAYFAFDDDPARIRASQRSRDANLDPDDRIEILIATLGDGRNAFWFQIGPAGGQGDALIGLSGSSFAKDWDGLWTGRSTRDDRGWFAEFEIPFATLDFDPALDEWRFNARRFVRRDEEESRWAAVTPDRRFFAPSEGGVLDGVGGIERGVGLDLKPFATGRWTDIEAEGGDDRDADGGLDAFWRISPNAKLALSINTDFAEAEVDDRQVNLTRFPLFFPEKRDFFLEDSSVFLFGPGSSNDVLPFFSRRIGLDAERRPVPILAAGKFVWRDERWSVGVLDAQIDDTTTVPSQNLGVLRVQNRIGEQSDIGAVVTAGDPGVDRGAQTLGVDVNLRTRELFDAQNGRASAWWIGSRVEAVDDSGATSRGSAFSAELDYPNDRHAARLTYTRVDEDFDPRLGFVRRPGTATLAGRYFFQPRIDGSIRQLEFGVEPTRVETLEGDVETESFEVTPLGVQWLSGDFAALRVLFERDVPAESFDLPGGLEVAAGDYSETRVALDVETSDRRPLALEMGFETGGFYGGDRRDYFAGVTWFQSALFNLGVDYELSELRLNGGAGAGDTDVHVASLRALLVPDPDLSLRGLLQYDSVSDDLTADLRLRWIRSPGNEFFLVVSQSFVASSDEWRATDAEVLAKIGWTLRF